MFKKIKKLFSKESKPYKQYLKCPKCQKVLAEKMSNEPPFDKSPFIVEFVCSCDPIARNLNLLYTNLTINDEWEYMLNNAEQFKMSEAYIVKVPDKYFAFTHDRPYMLIIFKNNYTNLKSMKSSRYFSIKLAKMYFERKYGKDSKWIQK